MSYVQDVQRNSRIRKVCVCIESSIAETLMLLAEALIEEDDEYKDENYGTFGNTDWEIYAFECDDDDAFAYYYYEEEITCPPIT